MQRTDTGIGRALRAARLRRGKSLEEASRDTRVKRETLEALEEETFESLQGDVYVRSFLRSYAKYLGLDPEKVIRFYEAMYRSRAPRPAPVEQSPGVAPTEAVVLIGGDRRPSWLLAAIIAGIVLAAAAAIGVLSRSASAPPPATDDVAPTAPAVAPTVRVELLPRAKVGVQAVIDGGDPIRAHLARNQERSFEGASVSLSLTRGGVTRIIVDGELIGTPGKRSEPYQDTFLAEGTDPSPAASG